MFITIVMTGLDQDMMQKNISCKSLKGAPKNMYWYGFAFLPLNLLFLSLGALLFIFSAAKGVVIPERTDDLFPLLATQGHLPAIVGIFFFIGLISATYASADSALASLTTSFSIDILRVDKMEESAAKKRLFWVHLAFSVTLALCILIFKMVNKENVVYAIFTIAGYTYGPLLGLFAYGLFTKRNTLDKAVPYIAIFAPIAVWILDYNSMAWFNIKLGFEVLMINGALTFLLLWLFSFAKNSKELN